MTTPETPETPADQGAAQPAAPAPEAASDARPNAPEPRHVAHVTHDEEGPQPGNAAPSQHDDDDDYGDGPAPGNEKFPGAAARPRPAHQGPRPPREPRPQAPRPAGAGAPPAGAGAAPGAPGATGSSKRRRRRRKSGARGDAASPTLPGRGQQTEEGSTPRPPQVFVAAGEGEVAASSDASAEDAAEGEAQPNAEPAAAEQKPLKSAHWPPREHDRKKRRDRDREQGRERGPRPDRERPAFNIGDVTFGKIVEMNDDVIFIDIAGKGRAIFDRRELDLPDDPGPDAQGETHDDAEHDDAPEAEATETSHDDTSQDDAPTATEAPDEFASLKPLSSEAAPAQEPAPQIIEAVAPPEVPSSPAPPLEQPPEQEQEVVTAAEVASELGAPVEAVAPPPEPEKAAEPAKDKKREPMQALPPVVLEIGAHFVGVVHNDGGRGGLVVLTRHPRRISKSKQQTSQALKDHTIVWGIVTGVIKGGLEVDVEGLRAFVPGSHMDLRKGADLSAFVGKRLDFYVTQYGKRGRDVVLSRKPMLEAEAKTQREEAIGKLAVGAVVEGIVRSVVPFGAFVDIGGIEGLVPLPEMSHNRSDGPSDVFKPGEKTQVKIMKIDDKGKVSLSRKAAVPDPWMEVAKKYAMGTRHTGKVARIQPFGVFVELENGIDGLIHFADLTYKRVEHPSEVVKVGETIEVVVAHVEASSHRIGLHPAPAGEAANEPPQRVQMHKMVKATVVAVEPGGLVVRINGVTGRNGRGFITGAATGTPRGTELRKPFPVGHVVEAKVMEIDPKRGEVKLSIKALADQTERDAYQEYRKSVNKEAKFTFGDLLKNRTQK